LARHRGVAFYTFIEQLRRTAKASRSNGQGADVSGFDALVTEFIRPLPLDEQLTWLEDAANAFRQFLTLTQLAESLDAEGVLHLPFPITVSRWMMTQKTPVNVTPAGQPPVTQPFRLVATAHPTTSMRKTTLAIERQLVMAIRHLERGTLPYAVALQRLSNVIDRMWATRFARWEGPKVTDESDQVQGYFTQGILPALQSLNAWVAIEQPEAHIPLAFGSWIGGDMDGNPNVNAHTFTQTVQRQRQTILGYYENQLRLLHDEMTHDGGRLSVPSAVMDWLQDQLVLAAAQPWALPMMADWLKREPLRLGVFILHRRVLDTLQGKGWPLRDANELRDGLATLKRGLGHYNAPSRLLALERLVQQCDFHLASLDLREDCHWLRVATHAVMTRLHSQWPTWDAATRLSRLVDALHSPCVMGEPDMLASLHSLTDPHEQRFALRLVSMLQAIKHMHQQVSPACCQNWVLSMCDSALDVASAMVWQKWLGLWQVTPQGGLPALTVVPLFETPQALTDSVAIMRQCWTTLPQQLNPMVMLGYSDSNKLCGIVTSQWLIYQTQLGLMALAAECNQPLKLFHGRGGNIGRGGGPNKKAIWAMPAGTCQYGQDVTEQGEVLSRHYNRPESGQVHLLSLLEAYALQAERLPDPLPFAWQQAMTLGSDVAQAVYGQLVRHPAFLAYFDDVTPREVELLRLGSRPSSRQKPVKAKSLDALRAIPWVFRWYQSRQIVPGWFGLGSALEAMAAELGWAELTAMQQGWPFFDTLLFNAALCLQQVDLSLARHYVAHLGENQADDDAVFSLIQAEHARTIAGVTRLLGDNPDPALRASIELKTPYLDPLNSIQVLLLAQYRALMAAPTPSPLQDHYEQAIMASIFGVSIGLGTTG
jgi:phosphoenolpyruvate carboxylase